MQVVYAGENFPDALSKSIFLAGPTPRNKFAASWRPYALHILEDAGYDGHVFVPERRDRQMKVDYIDQVEWEREGLETADAIAFWVPRDLKVLPAFITNVEFGRFVTSGKVVYGRPDAAPNNRYLDWTYCKDTSSVPFKTLEGLLLHTMERLGAGALRTGGETQVPLSIWRTKQFQQWRKYQLAAGNRIDGARLLWTFGQANFAYALLVKVWVAAENRHKENEFVISRPDISAVVAFHRKKKIDDSEILLVTEFRSPVRNPAGAVMELPSGSADDESPAAVAAHELEEECGVSVAVERLRELGSRQLAATLSSHHSHLFTVEFSAEEMDTVKRSQKKTRGIEKDSERTTSNILTFGEIRRREDIDWSMLGMIYEAVIGS